MIRYNADISLFYEYAAKLDQDNDLYAVFDLDSPVTASLNTAATP